MAERRQLPPQIRRVELARRAGSKAVVRYQLTVDTGISDGKRKQLRRRYRTEKEARKALAEIQSQVNSSAYVQPSTLTVDQACADWLKSRHKIRPTTAAGYEYVLQPVRSELGNLAVQDLTRRHIDELIVKLRAGSLERPGGRRRKAWSARSCNYMLGALSQVLAQLVAEGRLARNVAGLVDRVPGKARKFETFTADQVRTVLGGIAKDRNRHAWHLALTGLRRGEIAGLRWDDVDLDQRTVRIGKTRVDVGGRALDQDDPKTASAGQVLPLPNALLGELTMAKARQAAERLHLGEAYAGLNYWSVTRPASRTTPRRYPLCGKRPSRTSKCRRCNCTTPGIPAQHSCTCKAYQSRWSRPGWATPMSRSHSGPSCTRSPRHSNWRRAALLRRPQAPANDGFAHACGDINRLIVTICDIPMLSNMCAIWRNERYQLRYPFRCRADSV
jgi:integrase